MDHFALLNKHEHSNYIGMEGKDVSQKTMQQPEHANTNQPRGIKQKQQ